MRPHRTNTVLLLLAVLAALAWWWLGAEPDTGPGEAVPRERDTSNVPPRLEGAGEERPAEGVAPEAGEPAAPSTPPTPGTYDLEVLDYRNAGVPGVQVFHEVDLWTAEAGGAGRVWKTLASGTTDAAGRVRLDLDRRRLREEGEGLNHRIRVIPPEDREDLAPTWRLWSAEQGATYRLAQTHVVAGRVVDRDGEPVWDATVWVGDVHEGVRVRNPGWRKTRSDVDGYFRFAGLPTTSDWQIEVWAVGPGEEAPATSTDVRGWQTVALDTRTVELRLP